MTRNEICEYAQLYLEFCGNEISTTSFRKWRENFEGISDEDALKIFLVAVSLVFDNKI